jgi:hypothetical protein
MAHKLFIGGLSFSTSSECQWSFHEASTVESAVITDRDTGASRVGRDGHPRRGAAVAKFNGQDQMVGP